MRCWSRARDAIPGFASRRQPGTGTALPTTPRLTTPLGRMPGVGPATESRLARLGLRSLGDLLFHLPLRYIDRTRITPMGSLRPGDEALLQGRIELCQIRFGRRRSLLCRLSDGTGSILLRFFHFNRTQQAMLEHGAILRCWGQVRAGPQALEMIHPEYRRIHDAERDELEQALTPVYPTTERLPQSVLRRLAAAALAAVEQEPEALGELVPERVIRGLALPSLRDAVMQMHLPPPGMDMEQLLAGRHPAQRRLAFDELLAHQISLRLLRREVRTFTAPGLVAADSEPMRHFFGRLPFKLTRAQRRALRDVQRDLAADRPMLRLVQGDVGSGKTVIAAAAAMQAIASGYQAALMAPTELLAEQHCGNLSQWFAATGIPVVMLTGRVGGRVRRQALQRLAGGELMLAVGTHALLQEGVSFGRLGLAIIDEQHRFGVHQRLAFLEKGSAPDFFPHQLVLTATPIPRTLAMTMFADLDVSVIDELPPGRKPVQTVAASSERRAEVVQAIRHAGAQGRQAYWVCPRIEETDDANVQAAEETARLLIEQLPAMRIGLVHGRMPARERDGVMQAFRGGGVQVLVATTVIEVGVDVPGATLMVIENAERLGLAQLHQLRGRIGRGKDASTCVLLYKPPLSALARERLETMRATADGFVIAEKDLELRGPGELLGARQTGLQRMRVADLARDARILPQVQRVADLMIERHPERLPELTRRWVIPEPALGVV
ncbi:MAG: ATP-dependent DNA helicase RecG [Gammaproteobacteria bacterium]|nr:ATP-dependent DNA helicase RecG [Gammaproteobacteria bacterium]